MVRNIYLYDIELDKTQDGCYWRVLHWVDKDVVLQLLIVHSDYREPDDFIAQIKLAGSDGPSRLLKNTRIGLFSWPSCVSRPPRQRCARGHAVPTRGPATPAAGDQGHLASRFRNRTKL